MNTGCGQADSGVGPFYCPADRQVYIDLSFYDVLADQLGAKGEFAQPYVLAHEYGHHMQNLLGTEAQVPARASRAARTTPTAVGAAGAAGRLLRRRLGQARHRAARTRPARSDVHPSITEQDISEAVDTAEAIGDDAIQKRSGGRSTRTSSPTARPNSGSGGSGRATTRATRSACDTFGTDQL